MTKKVNNLNVKQLLEIKSFLDRQEEQKFKFQTLADLSSVAEKSLGFTITISNMQRVFREFDLKKKDYLKTYSGNSMMIQIAALKKKVVMLSELMYGAEIISKEEYDKLVEFTNQKTDE